MTQIAAPAGQHTVRQHNLKLVLAELVTAPGSRADLSQRTGLTKATVANLVDSLIEQRVLLERDPEASGPGRPSRLLSFHPAGPIAIGVEINIDYTAVCEVDLTGKLISHERYEIDNRGGSAELAVQRAAEICRRSLGGGGRPVLGVGLGLPGAVSPAGEVLRAPNLPAFNGMFAGTELARQLGPGFSRPILIENEANLGALEWLRAAAGVNRNFVYVSGEIGVGAGLVVDGALFRGQYGFAGELGHVVVEGDGPPCTCGGRGCVEQYAGQDVLLKAAGSLDLDALQLAIERGEVGAREAVAGAGTALGVGLSSLLNVVDLPMIVLGGLYARLFDAISPTLEAELQRRVLSSARGGWQLIRSALGSDAAVRGAAGLIIDRALKDPTHLQIV